MNGEPAQPPRSRSAPFPHREEGWGEGQPQTIALSLIAHTNVGKTTLARTLLDRDVGEVRDEPHVTGSAERYTMIETAQGDVLELWDTPGFGDSARLARRLAAMDRPIAALLAMTWDRFRDRALWSSQQAVVNVRDEADVVLYLVNASESPGDAGYVEPELRILEWIGKPVVALLNQTGPPREVDVEAADVARWQNALREHACIKGVLSLDAFARCWVQEGVLLREVAHVLPQAKLPAFARVAAAWQAERNARFTQSMTAIATPIAQAACDHVTLPDEGLRGAAIDLGRIVGVSRARPNRARTRAVRELSRHLDDAIRESTDRLMVIHHLSGRAADEVLARLAEDITTDLPWSERKAAVVGGFVSGALTGLAADLAAGGLTFGAGLLAGGIVGAMGGAGIARGVNLVRGKTESVARWSDELLASLVPGAVLRYLAVAHYGRGRGDFAAGEHPRFWRDAVEAAVERQGGIGEIVALRGAKPCNAQAIERALADKLEAIALDVLATLYPAADVTALRIESRSADNGRPA
ncbi:MAG TPA: DUF3482 domain-containing protein [Casimicrobiaceae bacterium]|nr:DUF3482 domain-containing protein [Casimicrobiaceae bacterium]